MRRQIAARTLLITTIIHVFLLSCYGFTCSVLQVKFRPLSLSYVRPNDKCCTSFSFLDRSRLKHRQCDATDGKSDEFFNDEESFSEIVPNDLSFSSRRALFSQGLLYSSSFLMALQHPDMAQATSSTYPGGNKKKVLKGGLPKKIESICVIMDELQRDLMQERWSLVEAYPAQLRSYVPIFTAYTDTAFSGDEPAAKGLRVALRYEVGRFFGSLERLRNASSRQDLNAAYLAYSDMALHFDRYLNVGNLYTYQDDIIDREALYKGIEDSALVFADPKKDPPAVRDLIVLTKGPDKGRTGILIAIYNDGSDNVVAKLDKYRSTSFIREIRVVPKLWAAKRIGEQDPDEVFLIPRKNG
mmetsp:Transcript_28593/g.42281  ORF Transcript_28593/g.42281 Transcript_28593/m.42281 type:complete len:356 (-) Transcript_28593:382-1449(-)